VSQMLERNHTEVVKNVVDQLKPKTSKKNEVSCKLN